MYVIVYNDKEIELPKYSFVIAEKLEAIELSNKQETKKFKEKCRMMYNFEKELIGEDTLKEIVGDFDTCDPNDINLVYKGIVNCYNQPVIDKQNEELRSLLNDNEISKLLEMVDKVDSLNKVRNKK